MWLSVLTTPPAHGQLGALDELIFYCLPLVIAIVVLAVASRRARRQEERTRRRPGAGDAEDTAPTPHGDQRQ